MALQVPAPKDLSDDELDEALLVVIGKYAGLHPRYNIQGGVGAPQAVYYIEWATRVSIPLPRIRGALKRLTDRGLIWALDTIQTVVVRAQDAEGAPTRMTRVLKRWFPTTEEPGESSEA